MSSCVLLFCVISLLTGLTNGKHRYIGGAGIAKSIDNIADEVETSFEPKKDAAEDGPPPPPSSYSNLPNIPAPVRPVNIISRMNIPKSKHIPSGIQIAHIKANRDNPAPRLLRRAIVIMRGNGPVRGVLHLEQMEIGGPVLIHGNLKGFPGPGQYGFHFHEYPVVADDCESAGEHYNPFGARHGSPDDHERHLGDLGNIQAQYHGSAHVAVSDSLISLSGGINSILGRSLVVHANRDDLGRGRNFESMESGNSGGRLACGNIVLVTPPYNNLIDG